MIRTRHMPGCTGRESAFLSATDRNRNVSRAEFRYVRCDRCSVVRLENPPEEMSLYYPDDYHEALSQQRLADIAARDTFKIDLVRSHLKGGRLLEIGPGFGVFAYQAKQSGFQVSAIEMDRRCCDHLNRTIGVAAVCSDAPERAMPECGPQDAVVLWHVIEHLSDPWAVLEQACKALNPNGILAITTPNPAAWQLRAMGALWPHVDAPRHLYLLPRQALTSLLEPLGMYCIHQSANDADARSWNMFAWQRLIMNWLPGRWLKRFGFVAGFGLGAVMAPFEALQREGSAYTLVMRKRS